MNIYLISIISIIIGAIITGLIINYFGTSFERKLGSSIGFILSNLKPSDTYMPLLLELNNGNVLLFVTNPNFNRTAYEAEMLKRYGINWENDKPDDMVELLELTSRLNEFNENDKINK